MSLNRRKLTPWALCALAALMISLGMGLTRFEVYEADFTSHSMNTTGPTQATLPAQWAVGTTYPLYATVPTTGIAPSIAADEPRPEPISEYPYTIPGYILVFLGCILAIIFVMLSAQERAYLGPEAELFVLALAITATRSALSGGYWELTGFWPRVGFRFMLIFACLVCVHGLWWWLKNRFPHTWSSLHRVCLVLSDSGRNIRAYLLAQLGAALVCAICGILYWNTWFIGSAATGFFLSAASLWRFAGSTQHLQQQLGRFRDGVKVVPAEGLFRDAETQLLAVQDAHTEAVQTAITGERFKVELISNVSHDLRTPLTSILGYGELLQKEQLSPEGTQQLAKLNQKAGYMRELVDSLFELTKVSSGVLESKKEPIDLIRLLEQTIGLYDDQLSAQNLVVRRRYCAESVPIATDGARMHQVFANLLGNAMKYALQGTRIHLEVTESETQCTVRMVNIASYEMDFRPEEILQRFARGDKARSTQGSGLGLAIAQTYTESVGGSFRVAIDGDQFSAFVNLPKE